MNNKTERQQRATSQAERTIQPLKVENVVCVYEGLARECCCGCAGEYYYNRALTELIAEFVGEHLIYEPKPEQFNEEKITAIIALVNNHIECGATYWSGGRLLFLGTQRSAIPRSHNCRVRAYATY